MRAGDTRNDDTADAIQMDVNNCGLAVISPMRDTFAVRKTDEKAAAGLSMRRPGNYHILTHCPRAHTQIIPSIYDYCSHFATRKHSDTHKNYRQTASDNAQFDGICFYIDGLNFV